MRQRIIGAVLFGFGVLALVLAGGLAFVVAPQTDQLPYDLTNTSVAEAPNATFVKVTNGAASINQANLRSTINVQTDAAETAKLDGALDGKAVVWLVGQDVIRTDTNERISAYSTSLALDRKTGAAADWDSQWLDTGNDRENVDYSGHMYKFPFGTEKKSYDIFDRDLLAAQSARFVKTEQLAGLETYQFVQEIRDGRQQLPDASKQLLMSQLLPGATSAEVHYSNTRTIWVEPTTGQFIKVQEDQNKTLVGDNGQEAVLLDALFTYTDDTVKKSADVAKSNKSKLQLVNVWAPIGLLIIGLLLVAVGLALALRSPRAATVADGGVPGPRRGRHTDAATEPGRNATRTDN